jgi:hypothetical protein
MPHSPSANKEGKRLELPDDGLRFVSKRSFSRFLAMLSAALGISIKIDGATSSQSRDGELNFKLSPGGGSSAEYAWTPTAASSTSINLSAGSISDGVTTRTPTVTGISVHETDLRYIYLVCTLNATRVDGFVTGGTVTAASISAYSAIQTNSDTTGYILLCTWQAGAVVDRFRYWSIECQINDNGGGGTAFNTWTAG